MTLPPPDSRAVAIAAPVPRSRHLPALAWLAALLLAGCSVAAPRAVDDAAPVAIKLIALNDFHGNLLPPRDPVPLPDGDGQPDVAVPLGGAAYLATAVRRLQAQNPLNAVVAAGDLVGASPLQSALFHDEPAVAALDAIGLAFSAVGNHEFDRGRASLLRLQQGGCAPDGQPGYDTCVGGPYPGAQFRWLAANVIDEASGLPLLPATAIREFTVPGRSAPLKVGFIGLPLAGTPDLVARRGIAGLRFDDEADTINRHAAALMAEGVRAIVVLIHEGGALPPATPFDDERCTGFSGPITAIVARLDPAIDAVVSGHTHRVYRCRLPSRDPARTILATSAGNAGRFLTDLDLWLAPDSGEVLRSEARTVAVVNDGAANPRPQRYPPLAADPAVAAIAADYDQRSRARSSRPVGRIAAALSRRQDAAGEMSLGYVIADAQRAAAERHEGRTVDLALLNPGGVRADLAPLDASGAVNFGQIYSVQPFGGGLVTMTLSGAQILEVLEQQWRTNGQQALLLPSSTLRYAWRGSQPVGHRVDRASVRLHGLPLDEARDYRVVVNAFLANSGDGFEGFAEGREQALFGLDREALIDYLSAGPPVPLPAMGPETGRIRRLD